MTGHRLLGLTGTAEIKITGACPEDFLTRITSQGVRFRNYRKTDELTALMEIPCSSLDTARYAAKKTMCTMETVSVKGTLPSLRGMKKRILVPVLLLLLVWVVFFLQSHIWFFRVQGSTTIPQEKILRTLEECGVGFWTKTDKLDMNRLKNQMLTKLPELGWFTINTKGGIATVVVRQRAEKPTASESAAPANVIAAKNGLITSVTTTGGTQVVKPGDMVSAGQLLISGVTNLDKTLMMTRAEGEVYARTWTQIQGLLPEKIQKKSYIGTQQTIYSLTFGKKTIKISKSSGISHGDYDKIIIRKPLTLPGGFTLPICLNKATLRPYTLQDVPIKEADAASLLEETAMAQLLSELKAGRVLSWDVSSQKEGDVYRISGTAECQEEIGTVVEIKSSSQN